MEVPFIAIYHFFRKHKAVFYTVLTALFAVSAFDRGESKTDRGFQRAATVLVATSGTPVPARSGQRICPDRTGAAAVRRWISAITAKIRSLGTGAPVLTDTRASSPPCTGTVDVTMRTGWRISSRAYCAPRGQPLPVTAAASPCSMVTVSWQPSGQSSRCDA